MQDIMAKLTAKNDKYACAIADKIISESQDTDEWYEYFDEFASLLNHPKSLVRNRVLYILAANAQWDDENRFDSIISDYLAHVTDEKPDYSKAMYKSSCTGWSSKSHNTSREYYCVCMRQIYRNIKIVCVH